MQGLYRSGGKNGGLHNIERGRCCKPKSAPKKYGNCYEQLSIGRTFDKKGLSKCRPNYLVVGLWKGTCNKLYCLEKFDCCRMR